MKWRRFKNIGGVDYEVNGQKGNSLKDAKMVVEVLKEEPEKVFTEEKLPHCICLVFKDKIVVVDPYRARLFRTKAK